MQSQRSVALALVLAVVVVGCGRKSPNASENQPANTPTQQAAAPAPAAPAASPPGSSEMAPSAQVKPSPPISPKPLVVPAGTSLTVRLDQSLSSKTAQQGDPFTATTAAPVTVAGKTAIPAGSKVRGVVTQSKNAGKVHGEGVLAVSLTELTVSGVPHPLSVRPVSVSQKGKGSRTGKIAGGSAAGGALIGGLAGGGKGAAVGALLGGGAGVAGSAMTGNKELELPAEATLAFRLAQPITLPPPGTRENAGGGSEAPSNPAE